MQHLLIIHSQSAMTASALAHTSFHTSSLQKSLRAPGIAAIQGMLHDRDRSPASEHCSSPSDRLDRAACWTANRHDA